MLSSSSCAHITSSFLIIILGSEWIDRVYTFFLFTSAKNRKRKHMSQLVQLRLYSRAQHALCGCQHSQAPNSEQRSFLCKSLGWQAGGLLCVTWHAFGKVVFELFPYNVCAPFAQAPPSLPCVLGKVPFLGHELSALRVFHPMPRIVQRGPHFLD